MERKIEVTTKPISDELTDHALDQASGGAYRIVRKSYLYDGPGTNAQVWTTKAT